MDTCSTTINFERTCRLCVKESASLNPICHSGNSLNDLIKECVDIVVQEEDKLPKQVCQECLDQMESWKSFKTSCQKSEDFLFALVNQSNSSVSLSEPDGEKGAHFFKTKSKKETDPHSTDEEGPVISEVTSAQYDIGNCEDENQSSQPDEHIMGCDDDSGSSTESAESVECIDITKDKPPKKNHSSLIRLANPESFKLLIEAKFLETNRNLYRATCSENYFACTADKVSQGHNCLLLELEKNVFCEVEFVMDGHLQPAVESLEQREVEGDQELLEVETILTEDGNTVNEADGVSYIILPSEDNETLVVDGNSIDQNQKVLAPSILQSILKSNSESKEALMFHKYARPAGEKAVRFLMSPSIQNSGTNLTFPVTSPSATPQFYQIAVPPNIQLVKQPNIIAPRGVKRSISDSGVTVSVPRKQKVLMPAPVKQTTPQRKPLKQNVMPAAKKQPVKPIKPPAKVKPLDDVKKFGATLKTADDITRRIQQIIDSNEEILQKTWGQYKKEEEEMDEGEVEEEQIFTKPANVDSDKETVTPGSPAKSQDNPNTRFVLQPIQNKDSETAPQKENVSNAKNQGEKIGKQLLEKPPPIAITLATPTTVPKIPIPRLPTAARLPPVKPSPTKAKSPPVFALTVDKGQARFSQIHKDTKAKNTKTKSIDDLLFDGLDLETSSFPATQNSEESTGENSDAPVIKYTINEEGLKEPILVVPDGPSGRRDWKKRIPDEMKMDPALLPKNTQRSKILQKFYLPSEPTIAGQSSEAVEQDEIKDVLFWADQLPDPPKDDETEADQSINTEAGTIAVKRLRKRKRKVYKKKPKPRIYTCNLCEGIAYAKFYELTHHDKQYHSDLPANEFCSHCGKCFIFEDRVRWHAKIYHAEKTMFCDLCDKGFSNKERLSMHKKLHSDKFVCDECGYRAPSSRKLSEHARKHTGEKPFMCDVCGMKLASKVSVKQHALKHTKESPGEKWQCKDCEFSSMNMTSFYNHRKRHQTVATFLCEECGQNVLTKSRLYKHMRFAHGPETLGHYVCGECNGIFHSKSACDDHLKEKHNLSGEGRSFVCKMCFKSYATKSACKKHFRTHNLG